MAPRVVGLMPSGPPAEEPPEPSSPRRTPPFVELAARSAFSLLDGASTPGAMARRAGELGMAALALADAFDLGGVVRFSRACRRADVRLLVGGEVSLGPRRRLVLLCMDPGGYRNLSALVTRARRSNPRGEPGLPPEGLEGRTAGLVALVRVCAGAAGAGDASPAQGGRGPGGETRAEGDGDGARDSRHGEGGPAEGGWTPDAVRALRPLFGERLYLALEHHGLPGESRRCARWIDVSRSTGIPWVPTNAPRYARPRDRIVRDVLTCLRHEVTLEEAGDLLLPNGEWYLKSARQMAMRWCWRRVGSRGRVGDGRRPEPGPPGNGPGEGVAGLPSARFRQASRLATGSPGDSSPACACGGCRALRRTREIADRCRFRMEELETRLPSFPVPGGRDADDFLRGLVEEGARERYSEELGREHREQIDHELGIISRLGLADYFLIVWDIVRFARRRGILVQGRGSAANSAVCYCLGVTAVDPVGMDLLFERFLSEERGEAPDIDLDIAHRDREEVLQYVYRTYGRDHAAMVCETITYRGRMAVRDAARVLGFSREEADRLSAEVERGEADEAAERLARGGAARAGLDPRAPRTRALIRVVQGLHRLPRHRSIHVGGFVLSSRPLGEIVPVEEASMEGRTIVQWDKDDLEIMGIIKFDLLGLGMLTVLGDALASLRRTRGRSLELTDIPPDDEATYDMICRADTVGVFQVESRAQMNTLPRVEPRCFYDLVVEVALIRPGPIQGEMVHPYLRRRRGEEPVTYLDPRLEPLLERTLGVPLFQEQGMKVAVTLAGFTPAQADKLRRAMGFKRSTGVMREVTRELEEGLAENDVPPEARRKVFKQLTGFADYGFPESHAASFALLVYASAWLKRHCAPEFYCALLNAQPMGFYSPSTLIHDARRHGVEVRRVDLVHSGWDCTLERARGTSSGSSRRSAGRRLPSEVPSRPGETATGRGAHDAPQVVGSPPGTPSPREDGGLPSEVPSRPDPALRLGLRLVDGLGEGARKKLRRARREAPFRSVEDVVRRSGLGEAGLRTLAEAGAFRSLWPGRREALWELLRELRGDAGPLAPRARDPGRGAHDASQVVGSPPGTPSPREDGGLPSEVPSRPGGTAAFDRLPPMSRAERVTADYRTLGLSPEGHPMEFLREELRRRGVLSAAELSEREVGERVRVAGIAICRQRPSTARGVVFVTLEDETGFANFVVLHEVQERYRVELRAPVLLMEGEVEREDEVVNVRATGVRRLHPVGGAKDVPARNFR